MNKLLPFGDRAFEITFGKIASIKVFKPYLNEIVNAISMGEFDKIKLDKILISHKIKNVSDIKEETLDLLLFYISFILDDNLITEKELANLKTLKRIFKIREGDFYRFRRDKIQEILNKQFKRIYEDNIIDNKEAILKVGLQELFDLGYDQFQELSKNEVKAALERGADLNDLDAVIKLSSSKNS
ncbi:MAG: hypothetical protein EPN39_16660 [Chitinophagaceae bacterium]|nr:MAG: hypothetical protein EPN39_16660 [Chitinophagaceae bacterium]